MGTGFVGSDMEMPARIATCPSTAGSPPSAANPAPQWSQVSRGRWHLRQPGPPTRD